MKQKQWHTHDRASELLMLHLVELRLKFLCFFISELLNPRTVITFLFPLLLCKPGSSFGFLFLFLLLFHLLLFVGLLSQLVVMGKSIFDELRERDGNMGWMRQGASQLPHYTVVSSD